MSKEASVRSGLSIQKLSSDGTLKLLDFNRSAAFQADVSGTKGPAPGAFTVTAAGTDCDLSQFTVPGLAVLKNLDATYTVDYGIRDPTTRVFYPIGELQPGESYVVRFSRNLQEDFFPSTGTGTTADINKLHFKVQIPGRTPAVSTVSCFVSVEAFEA